MSVPVNEQPHFQDDCTVAKESTMFGSTEQQPEAAGVGRAPRSEPERSDGERSGARPTPAPSPLDAPGRHRLHPLDFHPRLVVARHCGPTPPVAANPARLAYRLPHADATLPPAGPADPSFLVGRAHGGP